MAGTFEYTHEFPVPEFDDRDRLELEARIAELEAEKKKLKQQLTQANARIAELEAEAEGIKSVADQSGGVMGWHLNGDLATWEELFPEWYEVQQT